MIKISRALCIIIGFLMLSCQDKMNMPVDQYLLGSWVMDSSSKNSAPEEHPGIKFMTFYKDGKGKGYSYWFRKNKLNQGTFEYHITDTSFNVVLEEDFIDKAGYWFERLDENRFRLIAKFPVTNWSFPEFDSIQYYRRIESVQKYVEPIMSENKLIEIACNEPALSLLKGYWKEDSTEYLNRTSQEVYSYVYFDPAGSYHTFWLGYVWRDSAGVKRRVNNHYHHTYPIQLRGDTIAYEEHEEVIKCLDKNKLVIEVNTKSYYRAEFYSRVDPDTIIPPSLRVDRK